MSYPTPDDLWALELEYGPGLHGRVPWFYRRLLEASGSALWADYISVGCIPGDLPLLNLTTLE